MKLKKQKGIKKMNNLKETYALDIQQEIQLLKTIQEEVKKEWGNSLEESEELSLTIEISKKIGLQDDMEKLRQRLDLIGKSLLY